MRKLLFCLLLVSFSATAQRTLPYPIILIHGFNGNGGSTWATLHDYFRRAGLSVEPNTLSYQLNADGNLRTSKKELDVYEYNATLGNHDVYTINFDTSAPGYGQLSNQSGTVKQGYALGFAIRRVLAATRAQKVVLLGHSMGGLTAREYVQNPSNWIGSNHHRVAKLVTLGTPHGGSNLGSDGFDLGSLWGYDEESEAVRDLRTYYKTGYNGVYLYGGYESSQYIQRGSFGGTYYNVDVNCNGQSGDFVAGLNSKDMYNDLAYSCVIGRGVFGLYGDSDGVVLNSSQDLKAFLNTYYRLDADRFYYECSSSINYKCHQNEPKNALYEIMYALDEPGVNSLAYEINLAEEAIHKGFFTKQANSSLVDTDTYKISVSQSGILTINVAMDQYANGKVYVYYGDGAFLGSITHTLLLPKAGNYYVAFTGNSANAITQYAYKLSFCALPNQPFIVANSSTTMCEGESVTLSTGAGFANYTWTRNGQVVATNTNTIRADIQGDYAVQTAACGVSVSSANSIPVVINQLPTKPVINLQSQPFGLLASNANNFQWFRDGAPIDNANQALLSAVSSGVYTVRTTANSCTSESLPFVITATEPEILNDIKVYPTPSSGFITVQLPTGAAAALTLLDVQGKEVFVKADESNSSLKLIDLSHLPVAKYLLRIKTEQGETTRKVILQH